jgi:hypothetical protein
VVHEEHQWFRRRLPRAHSRSGDARPGRRRIGSGCFPVRWDRSVRNQNPDSSRRPLAPDASTNGAPFRPRSSELDLSIVPPLDSGSEPKAWTPGA